VRTWANTTDFKKQKVVALCLHRKILVTEVVLWQTMKLPTIASCLKEIKYAAKDKKDVPFFHHSSKRWAILVLVFSCSIL